MSEIVNVTSLQQFNEILSSSKIVVADFWAEWCGPCKAIAPLYKNLAGAFSRPGTITFTKVDVDKNKETAQAHGITAMPTFKVFQSGNEVGSVKGADPKQLAELVQKFAKLASAESESGSSGGSGGKWLGASLPRGYSNATDQVDVRGLDLLNADSDAGSARVLFDSSKPSGLAGATAGASGGKGKAKAEEEGGAASSGKKDWVESDTDEQLMLYIPFQSTLKVHTLHLTSLPPYTDDEDEAPMRPRTIKLYINRSTNMGFDEADSVVATQEFSIEADQWDKETGTAKLELRFVKFQNVTSLVVFVVDGDGDGEKTRIDRVRIVGEVGEKREMGKLEKVGEDN